MRPWTARIRRFPPARAGASTRAARQWGYVKVQRRRGHAGPHRSRGRAEIRKATQALAEMREGRRRCLAEDPGHHREFSRLSSLFPSLD